MSARSSRPEPETAIIRSTFRALRRRHGPLPRYRRALVAAWRATPPPFALAWYGETFRERALDPVWLAAGLARNAAAEGVGARKLWSLAGRTADARVADLVRRHAIDESRHALVYTAMLDTVFPSALAPADRVALRAASPRYRASDRPPAEQPPVSPRRFLDELIQMNIGEIRTRINQRLLAPVVEAVCPPAGRRRVRRMLTRVLDDETRHIGYTAALLDAALSGADAEFVAQTFRARLAQFNERTVDEIRPTQRRRR